VVSLRLYIKYGFEAIKRRRSARTDADARNANIDASWIWRSVAYEREKTRTEKESETLPTHRFPFDIAHVERDG